MFHWAVVQCLPPHSVSHGTVDCDYNQRCKKSYMYGSKCTVTCQSGYSLSGNPLLTCTKSRTWTGPTPICLNKNISYNISLSLSLSFPSLSHFLLSLILSFILALSLSLYFFLSLAFFLSLSLSVSLTLFPLALTLTLAL